MQNETDQNENKLLHCTYRWVGGKKRKRQYRPIFSYLPVGYCMNRCVKSRMYHHYLQLRQPGIDCLYTSSFLPSAMMFFV